MSRTRRLPDLQAAAIPLRNSRICLVPTRSGNGLIVPKGNIASGQSPWESAAQEAWEEAGLLGEIGRKPLGEYDFRKAGRPQRVQVFLLTVTEVARNWPEKEFRRRVWLSIDAAAARVSHAPLREFLAELIATDETWMLRAA